jgi:hypothetical protein
VRLLDGVAQASELGRLAEHDPAAVLLLESLVRSDRSRDHFVAYRCRSFKRKLPIQ